MRHFFRFLDLICFKGDATLWPPKNIWKKIIVCDVAWNVRYVAGPLIWDVAWYVAVPLICDAAWNVRHMAVPLICDGTWHVWHVAVPLICDDVAWHVKHVAVPLICDAAWHIRHVAVPHKQSNDTSCWVMNLM
jgi:hypothetical protein